MTEAQGNIAEMQKQLVISRNELKNLRQQLLALTLQHRKDVETIKSLLVNGPAEPETKIKTPEVAAPVLDPIGVIRTIFAEKRAVPRQSALNEIQSSYVEISPSCFNNPEHSLEGLEEFSHLWLIYHFHKNDSHAKAKVAPPRLNGERVGVFSTRSPHRPCPIGLSLVRIDRIEGNRVYFFGTDMVDDTPVFDLKPYIPQYDCPLEQSDLVSHSTSTAFLCEAREAPDGQETLDSSTATASTSTAKIKSTPSQEDPLVLGTVRVPNWITAGPTLTVSFNEQAQTQIDELGINRRTIEQLLETDPRSVYLRTKHGSQIFTFQLSEATVTCKFDDANAIVTVVQVRI